MPEVALHVEHLDVSYGPLQILFDVSLDAHDGEILALLGTNGAGKSTLLNTIAGLLRPTSGSIIHRGCDITGRRPERLAGDGVVLMPGGKGVFPTLTVGENLSLATWPFMRERERARDAIDRCLTLFPRLAERQRQLAGSLSGGEQQMLTLAQVLVHEPDLLMIDELSLGLAPTVVGELLETVRAVHDAGTTIILVEQSVNVALHLADRAIFLERGSIRYDGPTIELLDRPDLVRSVFLPQGSEVRQRPRHRPAPERVEMGPVLEIKEVSKHFGGLAALSEVSLQVHSAEIVGLIGQNGAGKSTLMDCISGFEPVTRGTIRLFGHDVTGWPPHWRALNQLGRSFQEARLFPTLSVTDTLKVALDRTVQAGGAFATVLGGRDVRASDDATETSATGLVELMGLGAHADALVGDLSTGTRRILELACIVAQSPEVVLLDEPSAGIAQAECEALGGLLRTVHDLTGCAIVIIEHDMPLLRDLCDRLVCMELGCIIADGIPTDVLANERVVASYLGERPAAIDRSRTHTTPRAAAS